MIDVIIPVYNSHDTIRQTLASVAFQTIKDKVKVTLVDDFSDEKYDYLIDEFDGRLNLEILRTNKNLGSGLCRQYGLDHTNNEYILFLDSDDLFYNYNSLEILYTEISKDYEYVDSLVLYENCNKVLYVTGELHGKIYRRSFLDRKKIKFNDTRFHEDNAFNSLVIVNNPKMKHLDINTYVYCKNNNSITNVNKKLSFMRLEIYIDNINYVVNQAINNKCDDKKIAEYIYNKYHFLARQYANITFNQKKKLKKWLNKYDFSKYLDLLKQNELREISIIL